MTITHLIHNDPDKELNIDMDKEPWVFQKKDDEVAQIALKVDHDSIYIKDTNGRDIDGFTIVCKDEDSVKIIYDILKSDIETITAVFPKKVLED